MFLTDLHIAGVVRIELKAKLKTVKMKEMLGSTACRLRKKWIGNNSC